MHPSQFVLRIRKPYLRPIWGQVEGRTSLLNNLVSVIKQFIATNYFGISLFDITWPIILGSTAGLPALALKYVSTTSQTLDTKDRRSYNTLVKVKRIIAIKSFLFPPFPDPNKYIIIKNPTTALDSKLYFLCHPRSFAGFYAAIKLILPP